MYLCVVAAPTRYPAVVWTMPFGLPVVPEVYSMKSMSSASIASAGHSRGCSGTRSCHQRSRFALMRTSCPVRRSTSTFSTTPFAIPSASSTRSLRWTTFPRRKPPSAVTITRDSVSRMRSAMDFALKPPKMTECGAPIRAHASIVAASSGTIGMEIVTRSPRPTPRERNAFAVRHVSPYNSWYVTTRRSPGSPSHRIAALLRRQDCTCRSRQFSATLSFAPTNHFACGRSHSSTFVHGLRDVTRAAAIFAQKPSKSFSARRWSSSPFTHARSRKEGGGANDCPSLRSESIVLPSLGIELWKPDVSLIDLAQSPRGASRGRPGGDVRRAREALRGRGGARWRVPRHSVRHHVRPARPERRGQDDTPPDLARAHGAELRDREGPRLEHPPP